MLLQAVEVLQSEVKRLSALTNAQQFDDKQLSKAIIAREWCDLEDLVAMLVSDWRYFNLLVILSLHTKLTVSQYTWATSFALASMWVFEANARAQSIETLTMASVNGRTGSIFDLSSKFKTSKYYDFQIVHGSDIVAIFVKFIRVQVIPEHLDSPLSALFVTHAGTPFSQGLLLFNTMMFDVRCLRTHA